MHNPGLQESFEDMQSKLGSVQIVDARPSDRFQEVSIKGSINVPLNTYFRDGVLKSKQELQQSKIFHNVSENSNVAQDV